MRSKNFTRIEDKEKYNYFVREDQSWFDFAITLSNESPAKLIAYNFEIRFPPEYKTEFIRFDLNPSGHRNEHREMRAHMHPGSDDILLPFFIMDPLSLLDLIW